MSSVVTDGLKSRLSDKETVYLQSFLNAGDRGGFYMAYYSMVGTDETFFVASSVGKHEASLQAKVATFSGPTGAIAFLSNAILLQEHQDDGYPGIYILSQAVAQSALTLGIQNDLDHGGTGLIPDGRFFDTASLAWQGGSVGGLFPGRLLPHDVGEAAERTADTLVAYLNFVANHYQTHQALPSNADLIAWAASDGINAAALATVYVQFHQVAGKQVGDYGAGYQKITTADGNQQFVVDAQGHVVADRVTSVFSSGGSEYETISDNVATFLNSLFVLGGAVYPALTVLAGAGIATLAELFDVLIDPIFDSHVPENWSVVSAPVGDGMGVTLPPSGIPSTAFSNASSDNSETLLGSGSADSIDGGGGNDAIFGGGNEDQLKGGAGNDIVWGQEQDDVLEGGAGDDVLRGGLNDDILKPGTGNDLVDGGEPGLALNDGGTDTADYGDLTAGIRVRIGEGPADEITAGIFHVTKGAGEDVLLSIEKVIGTSAADTVVVSSLPASVSAIEYIDLATYPAGQRVQDGVDVSPLNFGVTIDLRDPEDQTVRSLAATLHLRHVEAARGTAYSDIIYGIGGSDNGIGSALYGGDGADTLFGGAAADTLAGNDGDHPEVDDGDVDVLSGGAGADILRLGAGDIVIGVDSGDAVFLLTTHLTGGARKVGSSEAESLSGTYTDGYHGLTYTYDESTQSLLVSDGQHQVTIGGFVNGEAGIILKTMIEDLPPQHGDSERPPTAGDPLVLDLDGDGIELLEMGSHAAYFDIDKDGLLEHVGWAGPDDGFLVRDLNGDGLVNDIAEMFGDSATDGFSVLATFDGNGDGIINASDSVWQSLKVWRDSDSDGDTDPGELITLAQAGITGIGLNAFPVDQDVNGNHIVFRGTYTHAGGGSGEIAAAFLKVAKANPLISGEGIYSEEQVYLLPDLSSGTDALPTLRSAMAGDSVLRAEVLALVEDARTLSASDFRAAFEEVLLRWVGAADIDPGSHGPNVDARHLQFVATVEGDPLQARRLDGSLVDAAYFPIYGGMIEGRFETLVNEYLLRFGSQLAISEIALGIDAQATVDGPFAGLFNGSTHYDVATNELLTSAVEMGFWAGRYVLTSGDPVGYVTTVMPLMQGLQFEGSVHLYERSWQDVETQFGSAMAAAGVTDAALIEFAVDRLHGSERPLIDGGSGDDDLQASAHLGSTLLGRGGDDVLVGGAHGDTYVYSAGDGDDVIEEFDDSETDAATLIANADRLLLIGIEKESVTLSADGDDILLTFAGGGSILLEGQLAGRGIEEVVFAGGEHYTADDIAGLTFDEPITTGDDYIEGSRFADAIDGLAGDDTIRGGNGDDVLAGGPGNDTISGGVGDDTYVYRPGDGDDMLQIDGYQVDYEILRFEGIAPADVSVARGEDGMTIVFTIGGDDPGKVTVVPLFGDLGLDRVEFDGGVAWTREDLRRLLVTSAATDGDDHIMGINTGPYSGDNLAGGRGNDTLEGLGGSDYYHYWLGDGDDTIIDWDWGAGANALVFEDLVLSDLTFERIGTDQDTLVVHVDRPGGGSVTIPNAFVGAIGRILFADYTHLTPAQVASMLLLVQATEGDDRLIGIAGNDHISGLGGDDVISADGYDNVVDGGAGDDTISADGLVRGGLGDDTITTNGTVEYRLGDGQDVIAGGYATLRLLDIDPADVTFSFGPTRDDLSLAIAGGGSIDVLGQWLDQYGVAPVVAEIEFADGSRIDAQSIGQSLISALATAGDDVIAGFAHRPAVLAGGLGDDQLTGGTGADTYVYSAGDGDDVIVDAAANPGDRLVLHGIDPGDVTVTVSGSDAVLHFGGPAGGSLVLTGQFNWLAWFEFPTVDRIEFDDGTHWLPAELVRRTVNIGGDGDIEGTPGDDTLSGGSQSSTYHGGAGNDTITDNGGNDVFLFGPGDGEDVVDNDMFDGSHNYVDILRIDAAPTDVQATKIGLGLEFLILSTGDRILFTTGQLDFVEFSDGTRWDGDKVAQEAWIRGTPDNDDVEGTWGQVDETFLLGGGTDDRISPWGGNDTFIYRPGDGNLTIYPYQGNEGPVDTDTLWLQDLDPVDVVLSIETPYNDYGSGPFRDYHGADLVIRLADGSGVIRIVENFDQYGFGHGTIALERIKFGDGTIWALTDILAHAGVTGTPVADVLFGSEYGTHVIVGGEGNDQIFGVGNGDHVLWAPGDGNDVIQAREGAILELDAASTAATLSREGNDLLIVIGSETIRLVAQFETGSMQQVESGGVTTTIFHDAGVASIHFSDEVAISREQLFNTLAGSGTADGDMISGSRFSEHLLGGDGDDSLFADAGDDLLEGGAGDDQILGGTGDDTLVGGPGADRLVGGLGGDLYLWALGDGDDVIVDDGGRFAGLDELRLAGLTRDDVVLTRVGRADETYPYDALQIEIVSTGEIITIENQYLVDYLAGAYIDEQLGLGDDWGELGGAWGEQYFPRPHVATDFVHGLERIVFDGGSFIDPIALGGSQPYANPDLFRLSPDTVLTTSANVLLGNDIAPFGGSLAVTAVGEAQHGTVSLTTGGVISFEPEAGFLGTASFVYTMTDGHREMTATVKIDLAEHIVNQIQGGDGDDSLTGTSGDDVLIGGRGDDLIDGAGGNDVAAFTGASTDYLIGRSYGGMLTVEDSVGNDGWDRLSNVDTLYFAGDDTYVNVADLPAFGTNGPDVLTGSDLSDYLQGLGGADTLSGGAGDDGLEGGSGNDAYTAGTGTDWVWDQAGDDIYYYNLGDGDDDYEDGGGFDQIFLGAGISESDVTVGIDGDEHLVLTFAQGGRIWIWGGATTEEAIEEVHFANGPVWTLEDLIAMATPV